MACSFWPALPESLLALPLNSGATGNTADPCREAQLHVCPSEPGWTVSSRLRALELMHEAGRAGG